MASRLRVDHFPKNGKTSANPKLPVITKSASPKIREGKRENMPEMRKKALPALATANKTGQGQAQPKFGLGDGKGTYAKGGISHPKSHAAFHALGTPKGGKY